MSKTEKKYTFLTAIDRARDIFFDLSGKQLTFTFSCKPEKKELHFVSVKDADTVKVIFSDFEIKQDVHKQRYAELILSYE